MRGRVEALKKNDGRVSEEQWSKLAMAPAIYQPDLLFDQAIKGYLDPQYHSVHVDADKLKLDLTMNATSRLVSSYHYWEGVCPIRGTWNKQEITGFSGINLLRINKQ